MSALALFLIIETCKELPGCEGLHCLRIGVQFCCYKSKSSGVSSPQQADTSPVLVPVQESSSAEVFSLESSAA